MMSLPVMDSTTPLLEPHPWTALPHRQHHPLVQYPKDSTSLAPFPVNKQEERILLDFLTLNDSL